MNLNEFLNDPTGKTHQSYKQSMFTFEAAEYATGEVLLASAYRKLLLDLRDASIDLAMLSQLKDNLDRAFVQVDHWFSSANLAQTLMFDAGGVASPQKSGQQGLQPLRSLMPIVPEIARHAGVLGRVRSRWNPGNLLMQVIGAGFGETEGNELVRSLTEALLITQDDDLFARFLADFLERAETSGGALPKTFHSLELDDRRGFRGQAFVEGISPAERFCKDLGAVLGLKPQLTRRQWCVLLEAALRLGLATHVLWVCQANSSCWQLALAAAEGNPIPDLPDIERKIWTSHRDVAPLLEIGRPSAPCIKRILERYMAARFGLNILLYRLEDESQAFSGVLGFDSGQNISAAGGIREFLVHVQTYRLRLDSLDPAGWLRQKCSGLCDKYSSQLASKTGSTKNLLEFVTYSLGQLKTTPPERRSYDQAFLMTSDERSNRKQQVAQPGPAMLIFLAHASCQTQGDLPVSLEDFRLHLNDYGLHTPAGELLTGRLCFDLQNLGLVVDSPDAAGGRILVRPF